MQKFYLCKKNERWQWQKRYWKNGWWRRSVTAFRTSRYRWPVLCKLKYYVKSERHIFDKQACSYIYIWNTFHYILFLSLVSQLSIFLESLSLGYIILRSIFWGIRYLLWIYGPNSFLTSKQSIKGETKRCFSLNNSPRDLSSDVLRINRPSWFFKLGLVIS